MVAFGEGYWLLFERSLLRKTIWLRYSRHSWFFKTSVDSNVRECCGAVPREENAKVRTSKSGIVNLVSPFLSAFAALLILIYLNLKFWFHQITRRILQGSTTLSHFEFMFFMPKCGRYGMMIFSTQLYLTEWAYFFWYWLISHLGLSIRQLHYLL